VTGRIKSYDVASATGFIESDSGHDVSFDASVVVAYDVTWLAVGQPVTYQPGTAAGSKASHVSVETPRSSSSEARREPPLFLRYLGFDHNKNIRSYRFERVVPGSDNVVFVVTTDLELFAKHHVGIQEGPGLCRALLMSNMSAPRAALTEADLLAFLSTRVVAPRKPFKRRIPAAHSDEQPEIHAEARAAFGSL
jgi:cold shock CspA family protein